jgi:hypothetical protein
MYAAAIASSSLKPAVPPLLSRCFACCYSAVRPLFSTLPQAPKTQVNQSINDVSAQFSTRNSKPPRRWARWSSRQSRAAGQAARVKRRTSLALNFPLLWEWR